MTYKEVASALSSYINKLKLLKLKEEKLEEAKQKATSIQATSYDKAGGKSCSIESVVERAVLLVEKYEEQFIILQEEIFKIEDMIADALPRLDEIEQSLIIERYMNCKPMCIIAKKYHYSYDRLKHRYYEIYKKIASEKVSPP